MSDSGNPFCPHTPPDVEVVRDGVHWLAFAALMCALAISVYFNILLFGLFWIERHNARSWRECTEAIQRFIPDPEYQFLKPRSFDFMTTQASSPAFDQWAIVDVMGHQRYVGHVTEQVVAGTGFVRIDVPAEDGSVAFTKLIGAASIYAISPVSEHVAREMAKRSEKTPIAEYDLPRPALPPQLLTRDPHQDYDDAFDDEDKPF